MQGQRRSRRWGWHGGSDVAQPRAGSADDADAEEDQEHLLDVESEAAEEDGGGGGWDLGSAAF